MRALVLGRNQNSTCSVAGEICRLGTVWDEDGLEWILARHHLRLAGLQGYISCIDMERDTLQHGVYIFIFFCLNLFTDSGVWLIASYGGPAKFATKLHKSPGKWNATGELDFLNKWCVFYYTFVEFS